MGGSFRLRSMNGYRDSRTLMTKVRFDTLALVLIVILGLLLVVEKEVIRVGTVPAPAQREKE